MTSRGFVLINALVVVLTISAVATAMLLRTESLRVSAENSRTATQLSLYLDSAEHLVPQLLTPVAEAGVADLTQAWAQPRHSYPIDRGRVQIDLSDLQSRLNLNWLRRGDDATLALFSTVFNDIGVAQARVQDIERFLRSTHNIATVDQLAAAPGLTKGDLSRLAPFLAALPNDSRINLNTAPDPVLRAALHPFPPEILRFVEDTRPLLSLGQLRRETQELLETEDVDHLPFDRLTVSSTWFQADLLAQLDGQTARRRVIFALDPTTERPITVAYRWVVFD